MLKIKINENNLKIHCFSFNSFFLMLKITLFFKSWNIRRKQKIRIRIERNGTKSKSVEDNRIKKNVLKKRKKCEECSNQFQFVPICSNSNSYFFECLNFWCIGKKSEENYGIISQKIRISKNKIEKRTK